MNNFDFLRSDKRFETFADIAISAENILHIDTGACILNCRRAMEHAIKWMYSVDDDLKLPDNISLANLLYDNDFQEIVGEDLWKRLDYIRKCGNNAAHGGNKVTDAQAELCIENLFHFLDFVAYCYDEHYEEREFNPELLELTTEEALSFVSEKKLDIEKLVEENQKMKEMLTSLRQDKSKKYIHRPLNLSEYRIRRLYIDAMISEARWIEDFNWLKNVEIPIPGEAIPGQIDDVLYGSDGKVLAFVESKRTYIDIEIGRQKALIYADVIEGVQGSRPIIYLSNGFETRIIDHIYPERFIDSIYTLEEITQK